MIIGAHVLIYSKDADADRAFLRDVLGFSFVDAGGGRLFFKSPPAELALHESERNDVHELYLMTDDANAEIARLQQKGVACAPVVDRGWGLMTSIALPGGGKLGLYEPRHPTNVR